MHGVNNSVAISLMLNHNLIGLVGEYFTHNKFMGLCRNLTLDIVEEIFSRKVKI